MVVDREPEWSDTDDERDDRREPLFWLFVAIVAIVAVLAFTSLSDDGTDATFAVDSASDAGQAVTTVPLPTAVPTPTPAEIPALVEVRYAVDAVSLIGTVPADAVADALISAAAGLVGREAVTIDLVVDEESSLSGGAVVLNGEIDDEADRAVVVAAFADLGLVVDDRLIIAGSDLSIADVLAGRDDLGQMSDFLNAAGLLAGLAEPSEDGFTLFAPTDQAIQDLDTIALDELSDATQLTEVLQYHVVPGTVTTRELAGVTALTSVQGESIPVQPISDGAFLVGDAVILTEDVDATNGVVHVIDAVLLPGTLRTEVALNEIVTLDPILFGRGSAEILEESFPVLDQAAQLLLESPGGRVEIQGHTDSDGSAEINLDLSQRRADSVLAYLVDQGVDELRLNATGYGETQLKIDPEESDEDKAANRRIEFRVG